jgi:hypothetical protein
MEPGRETCWAQVWHLWTIIIPRRTISTVRDVTNFGAGLRTQDIPILPLTFELSFDNFRTVRRCRLIWRDGDFLGVAFQN